MTTLRETTKQKIFSVLEGTYFTGGSFSANFNENQEPFLVIRFIPNANFTFSVKQTFNVAGYVATEAPGVHIENGESYKYDNLDACIKAIGKWAERILEDYRSKNPIIDEFEQLRKTLFEQVEGHIKDQHSHFTPEEISGLRSKLDELDARLKEVCDKNSEYEHSLREAHREIEKIKADLELFPKGVWYRVAGAKVLGLIKKVAGSQEGRELALEAAKKFLLDGPK